MYTKIGNYIITEDNKTFRIIEHKVCGYVIQNGKFIDRLDVHEERRK